ADGIAQLCEILRVDDGYLHSRISFFVTFLGQDIESETTESPVEMAPSDFGQKPIALIKRELDSPGSALDPKTAFTPLGGTRSGSALPDKSLSGRALQESKAGRYSDCARDLQATALADSEDGLLLA